MHALGLEFGSAARLSKRPGSVWNCLWGNALKRSPGIIRKSRVSYPGPGFLSSATWPSLPKKRYNGLNQTKSSAEDAGEEEEDVFEAPDLLDADLLHESAGWNTQAEVDRLHDERKLLLVDLKHINIQRTYLKIIFDGIINPFV